MALFNFSRPASNNDEGSVNDVIRLIINDETVEVTGAQAAGKTVEQLFTQYASASADVSRINRYVAQGRIVSGSSAAEAGTVYSGAIASESKG